MLLQVRVTMERNATPKQIEKVKHILQVDLNLCQNVKAERQAVNVLVWGDWHADATMPSEVAIKCLLRTAKVRHVEVNFM